MNTAINTATHCGICHDSLYKDAKIIGPDPATFSGRSTVVTNPIIYEGEPISEQYDYRQFKTKKKYTITEVKPCNHQFHFQCIKEASKTAYMCPIDKTAIDTTNPPLNENKHNYLLRAIKANDLENVKRILNAGSKEDFKSCFKQSPLKLAAQKRAWPIVIELINKGLTTSDKKALFLIGEMYKHGTRHNTADQKEAATWYKKSAVKGYAKAQFRLGMMYHEGGGGVNRNHKMAVYWLTKANQKLEVTEYLLTH